MIVIRVLGIANDVLQCPSILSDLQTRDWRSLKEIDSGEKGMLGEQQVS